MRITAYPYRSSVDTFKRAGTAIFGSYALASEMAAALPILFRQTRLEAVSWALLLGMLAYPTIFLWCYGDRRLGRVLTRVWGGAVCGALLLAAASHR